MSAPLPTYPGLSRRGWSYLGLAAVALLIAVFAYSGVVMAAMFAFPNAPDFDHWRHVALAYAILLFVALGSFVSAVIAVVRIRRRQRRRIAERAV